MNEKGDFEMFYLRSKLQTHFRNLSTELINSHAMAGSLARFLFAFSGMNKFAPWLILSSSRQFYCSSFCCHRSPFFSRKRNPIFLVDPLRSAPYGYLMRISYRWAIWFMCFSPSHFTLRLKCCFLLFQSRTLTRNVAFSADARPAVDGSEKLYHKRYTLTIHLGGKKENGELKTRVSERKAIFLANICGSLKS